MRLALNFANAHLIYHLELSGGVSLIKHNGLDVIVATLPTGEDVAIHLVERDIDVGLIKDTLAYNAQRQQATLFVLWVPMLLPDHGMRYRPYDWMHALLALYDDRIYGFEVYNNRLYVFPVYFDRLAIGLDRLVRYGERVEMAHLHTERIRTDSQHLTGYWTVARFEYAEQRANAGADTSTGADGAHHEMPSLDPQRNALHAYFAVLGLPPDADWETVRKAYRQLARQFHPDLNTAPDATERMQQINTAYQRLGEILGERDV
jgi:hypothetical protein